MRASTEDGYSPGYVAFTSRALLALRRSIVSEQFVLLAKSTSISSFSIRLPPIQSHFEPNLIYLAGFARIAAWWCGFRPSETVCQGEGEER